MTKKEAKKYIDNYISHIVAMTEYGNWLFTEIKELTDKAKEDCDKVLRSHKYATTKKVCSDCMREIDDILISLDKNITSLIEEEVVKLSEVEEEWLEENTKPLGVKFNYPDKATKLLLSVPIASAGIVGQYGKTVSDRLSTIYNQKIMTSYVSGNSFEDLETQYESRFNSFNRGLQTDSETLGESLATQYDRIIYTANKKQIKGYVWSAILDTSTCLVCGELSGKKFTDIDKVPVYPCHSRCRCILIPFTEDIEDVIPETYSEWFEEQSDKDKRHILGKKRFELYEQGMKIKNFVNNGQITPLKDLKK